MEEKMFPEEGELVLCKVKEILKTSVFVNLEKYGKTGVIPTSEIAAGRIRNIRDYVVVNKKIICKVLRIDRATEHIDLSLRRATQKETREEMQKYEKEEVALKILEVVVKKDAEKTAERIRGSYPYLHGFFESAIGSPDILEKFLSKEDSEKVLEIIKEKMKPKKIFVKAVLSISSTAPNGLAMIKDALLKQKDVRITYVGAPKYLLAVEDVNYKTANKKLENAIASISELMKKHGGKVEMKEKP